MYLRTEVTTVTKSMTAERTEFGVRKKQNFETSLSLPLSNKSELNFQV